MCTHKATLHAFRITKLHDDCALFVKITFNIFNNQPQVLRQAGVVPGADMTTEAALTKISYVLGKNEFDMAKRKDVSV